jgi:hypothetical protein
MVRLLVWSLPASTLPFAAKALGNAREESDGRPLPLFCRHEMKLACPRTALGVAPVMAGYGVKFQDVLIAAGGR